MIFLSCPLLLSWTCWFRYHLGVVIFFSFLSLSRSSLVSCGANFRIQMFSSWTVSFICLRPCIAFSIQVLFLLRAFYSSTSFCRFICAPTAFSLLPRMPSTWFRRNPRCLLAWRAPSLPAQKVTAAPLFLCTKSSCVWHSLLEAKACYLFPAKLTYLLLAPASVPQFLLPAVCIR